MHRTNLRLAVVAVVVLGLLVPQSAATAVVSERPKATVGVRDTDGRVYAIAQIGKRIYIGGKFTRVGRGNRRNLAAIDARTGRLLRWNPRANAPVRALIAAPGGNAIYIGGEFTQVNSRKRLRLARIGLRGKVQSWRPYVNNGYVRALAANRTTLYLGGTFTEVRGKRRLRMAAVGTGSRYRVSRFSAGTNRGIRALALRGRSLYMAGGFTTVRSRSRTRIARVYAKSGRLQAWSPSLTYPVLAVTTSPNGARVYTGGGGPRASSGNALNAFSAGRGARRIWSALGDGDLQAVVASRDTVYVGGHFNRMKKRPRGKLAAFVAANGNLRGFNPNANSPLGVFALRASRGGLNVGGDFTRIGGRDQRRFARLPGRP